MNSEMMVSGSSFQVLLLLILVICISVFFFFEIRKTNLRITSIEMQFTKSIDELRVCTDKEITNDKEIPKDINEGQEVVLNYISDESVNINKNDNDTRDPLFYIETEDKPTITGHPESDAGHESNSDAGHESNSDDDHESNSDDDHDSNSDVNQKHIEELQALSVKELKTILQERNLTVSGNKTTMINRIIDSLK